jgi:hypothetical protein
MFNQSGVVSTRSAVLLFIVLFVPTAAYADAILPSLALVWPITILLFIPIVLIEAVYARWRLEAGFWKITGVTAVANLLSTIAGLPIASVFAAGLEYSLEAVRFWDVGALRARAEQLGDISPERLGPHNNLALISLGIYPKWIMIVSAVAMMVVCYLVSWWVEGKWLQRYIKRTMPASANQCMNIAKNANLLSYAFLTVVVVWALLYVWPSSMN